MINRVRTGLAVVAAAAFMGAASADIWYFESNLTGDQHVPSTGSEAFGTATLVYDSETGKIDIDLYVEGIEHADLLYAHLHQGRLGFYGDMLMHLGNGDVFVPDGNGLRRTITGADFPQDFDYDLFTGGTYINVHSVQWEAGEIRGQPLPSPLLTHTALKRGTHASLSVSGAQPSERVYFAFSWEGVGESDPITQLGGIVLDLNEPVTLAGVGRADINGRAVFEGFVSSRAPALELAMQAVIARGPDSVKSNTQTTAVMP
ncbi:MAG: CHRD domain-containing protein [Phycisphaerales bacterium]